MRISPSLRSLAAAVSLVGLSGTASAAVIAFEGGDTDVGTVTGNPGNFVLDAGYMVPSLPDTDDRIIFETGGDGIGTTLALVGTSLVLFQDQNNNTAPNVEPSFSLDISAVAGQTVTIRLDGNYALANGMREINLTVVPTTGSNLTAGQTGITTFDPRFSGGDGTGFGGFNGGIGGNSEGFSGVNGLQTAERNINSGSPTAVLGGDVLVGTLYTGGDANTQRTAAIPDPSSFVFVPEPSAALLLFLGLSSLVGIRRR